MWKDRPRKTSGVTRWKRCINRGTVCCSMTDGKRSTFFRKRRSHETVSGKSVAGMERRFVEARGLRVWVIARGQHEHDSEHDAVGWSAAVSVGDLSTGRR